MKIHSILTFGLISLCVVGAVTFMESCSDDTLYEPASLPGEKISFKAQLTKGWIAGNSGRGADNDSAAIREPEVKGYRVDGDTPGDPLYIFESVSDNFNGDMVTLPVKQSRGTVVSSKEAFSKTQMGVYAYFTAEESASEDFYMKNVPYVSSKLGGVESWSSTSAKSWPLSNSGKIQFFAYSPYNASSDGT